MFAMRNVGRGLGWVLGAMLGLVACGKATSSGARGDSDGSGGGAGAGGQAEPTSVDGCKQEPTCASFGDCSARLAELSARCSDSAEVTRYNTECGGSYVEATEGVTESSWLFDPQGKLIGASYEDESSCSSWGSTCPSVGAGSSLCGRAQGECVSHARCAEWGANLDCPATLDDVAADCRFAEITIERYVSDCGGTLVDATNGVQQSRWTFDANGKLIGAHSMGDLGDCDYWGTRCQPIGKPEPICAAAGAGGLGGASGMGGAD